jgi:hypothetical protein
MDLSWGYIDQVWPFLKKKLKSSNIKFIFDLEYRYAVLSRGMQRDSFAYVSVLKPNLPSAIMRETLFTTHAPDGFWAYFQLEWMLLW